MLSSIRRFASAAVAVSLAMLVSLECTAATPQLLTTGAPGAIVMRTDGHWYVKGVADTFSTAPVLDSSFPHDQMVKFDPGQFALLSNAELWTKNTEVVSRVWNTVATPGQWYKIATNVKDYFLASNFTTTSSACGSSCPPPAYFLFILTKDGHAQIGAKGGFVDYVPGKNIAKMVLSSIATTPISTGPGYVANMHFFGADGAIYTASSVDATPFVFDANGKMTGPYGYFNYKGAWRMPATSKMASQSYTQVVDAIDHTDGSYIYLKTGEVLLAAAGKVLPYVGFDTTASITDAGYFLNLNTLLSMPAESFKQVALGDAVNVTTTGSSQSVQALTNDGRVFSRGDNSRCQISLPGCPVSSGSWIQVADSVTAFSMINNMATGQNGTWYAKTNLTLYYSGTQSTGNAAQGGAISAGRVVAGRGFVLEPVDTLSAIPDSPKHFAATDGSVDNNVQLSWDSSLGATTYEVYASLTSGSKGILVQEVTAPQTSTMAWCDPARLPPAPQGQPSPTCSNSFYASPDAITLLSGARDGRNIYFTVSAKNVLGESIGNQQDVGYVNIPITSTSVTIKADYNGSGSAVPVVTDLNQSDVFTVAVLTQPNVGGTVTLDPSTNRLTYAAAIGFTGSDTFTYSVKDKGGTPIVATGNVMVACPAPVLSALTLSPYPAIQSGVATLKYTLASCAKNATLSVQLFNGAQPADVLATPSSPAYQLLPTGVDRTIAVPFANIASANYTVIATIQDTVQGIQTQTNFTMPLLDTSRAYYELNSPNWAPHTFVEPMTVTLDAPGEKFCDLSVSADDVRASLVQDKPLKCLLEWTGLPAGLAQKPKQLSPVLVGAPTQTGTQEIKWVASVLRTNGDKVPYASGSKSFAAVAPLTPTFDVVPATASGDGSFTVPSTGGFVAKLTVDSMGAGVHTSYAVDGGTPVQFDTPSGQSFREIELGASPMWSQRSIHIKSAYTALPSVFAEKTVQVLVVPSDKIKLNLDVPATGLNNASIPVTAHIGIQQKGTALVYDPVISGHWTVRIAQVNPDKSLQFLTAPVDMAGGTVQVPVPALNSMTPPVLVAVADLVSPLPEYAKQLQSDSRVVGINKGTPLLGKIISSKASAAAPISVTFTSQMASKDDVTALGRTDFMLSIDNGGTWTKISTDSEGNQSRMSRNLAIGSFKVKGVFTNKFSKTVSESDPIDVVTYKLPVLSVEGPKVSYPGTSVTLNAIVKDGGTINNGLHGGPVDPSYVVEWQPDDGSAATTGTSLSLQSDVPKILHINVRARLAVGDPNDRGAWVNLKAVVTFASPAVPKVRVAGPALLETGKVGVFQAIVQPPWGASASNLQMDGEWTLPSGEKRQGLTLEWTPVDGDVSPIGDKRPVTYTAWVKGYNTAGTVFSATMGTKVWKYTWPTWTMKVARDTTYAPSTAKIDVVIDNTKLAWQFNAEPLSLTWNFPPNAVLVKVKDASAQLSLQAGGNYPVSLTLSDKRGNVTTLTQDLIAYDAPPFNIDVKLSPSNAMWRVPVTVGARPTITGGHPFDKVLSYAYTVDGVPVENRNGSAQFSFTSPGDHQVALSITSKLGAAQTKSMNLVVVPNRPPSCDMTAKTVPGTKFVTIISTCGDADGKIVGYRWSINGQVQSTSGNRLSLDFSHMASPAQVDMDCTDDSGAVTTISRSVAL